MINIIYFGIAFTVFLLVTVVIIDKYLKSLKLTKEEEKQFYKDIKKQLLK